MLIKCIECGKMFSSYAENCPECGCPTSFSIKEVDDTTLENIKKLVETFCDTYNYDAFIEDFEDEVKTNDRSKAIKIIDILYDFYKKNLLNIFYFMDLCQRVIYINIKDDEIFQCCNNQYNMYYNSIFETSTKNIEDFRDKYSEIKKLYDANSLFYNESIINLITNTNHAYLSSNNNIEVFFDDYAKSKLSSYVHNNKHEFIINLTEYQILDYRDDRFLVTREMWISPSDFPDCKSIKELYSDWINNPIRNYLNTEYLTNIPDAIRNRIHIPYMSFDLLANDYDYSLLNDKIFILNADEFYRYQVEENDYLSKEDMLEQNDGIIMVSSKTDDGNLYLLKTNEVLYKYMDEKTSIYSQKYKRNVLENNQILCIYLAFWIDIADGYEKIFE